MTDIDQGYHVLKERERARENVRDFVLRTQSVFSQLRDTVSTHTHTQAFLNQQF